MVAPMTPAAPMLTSPRSRSREIIAKENAIKRRLDMSNAKNKVKAASDVASQIKSMKSKGKRGTVSKDYTTQSILGKDKGFAQSDYGVGPGAAIPYQIGSKTEKVTSSTGVPVKPKPRGPSTPDWATSIVEKARKKAISNRLTTKGY